ncbi:hypothetical protein J6590_092291, partial [Homalodisca vitripennis]
RVLGRARPKTAELPHEGSPYRSINHSRALSFSTEAALSRLLCCSCHPAPHSRDKCAPRLEKKAFHCESNPGSWFVE